MKKLLKCALLLALAVSILTGAALAAGASITYDGGGSFDFRPGSEYTATDLFDGFKGVMPGDTRTEEITFVNNADDCDYVRLYIRAVAHDEEKNPLSAAVAETETVATMTEFLAQLSMKVWNGTELIYKASPDELDGLAENVLLGTFRQGEEATLTVELTAPATLGNEFSNRVGEVDWVFHVDACDDPAPSGPKTGDEARPLMWLGMMALCAGAALRLRKRSRA